MNKFRPQEVSKLHILKERRNGINNSYNWQSRIKWYPAGWGFNKRVIGGQFSRLHYLACHAPKPIQAKWFKTYRIFYQKRFGSNHASVRFLNKWSCHSWL